MQAPHKVRQQNMFRNMTAAQASGQRSTISVHSAAARVYIDHLVLTLEQKQELEVLYDTPGQICDTLYHWNSSEDQATAAIELAALGLDDNSKKALDSRWSVHWASGETNKRNEIRRVLYQW